MPPSPDIRLLAIDLDGTLLGQGEHVISEANATALRLAAQAGVEVVPISARPPFGILHPLRSVDIFRLMVAYNGALICDRQAENALFNRPIDPQEARQAMELLLENDLYIACYVGNEYYVRQDCPEAQLEANALGCAPLVEPNLISLCGRGVHKLLSLELNDPSRLQRFYGEAVRKLTRVSVTCTSPISVEVNHHEVSKGSAVRWVANKLGFSLSQVMAVGDSYNDVSLFSAAGLSVAIGGAPDELQRLADWVAPPVNKGGAAAAIWRFILEYPRS